MANKANKHKFLCVALVKSSSDALNCIIWWTATFFTAKKKKKITGTENMTELMQASLSKAESSVQMKKKNNLQINC